MNKVFGALAALSLAASGNAIAQPANPVDTYRAAVNEANQPDSSISWSELFLSASRAFEADPTFTGSDQKLVRSKVVLGQKCFASILSDNNMRTWARHNPILANRLWQQDSTDCAPIGKRITHGVGPVIDGQEYAEMIQFESSVMQDVMAAKPHAFDYYNFDVNPVNSKAAQFLKLTERTERPLNSN